MCPVSKWLENCSCFTWIWTRHLRRREQSLYQLGHTICDIINCIRLEGQSTTKIKLVAQPPGRHQGSQFVHLYKRMLREKLASFHPWASPILILYFLTWGCHYSKQTVAWMDENVKYVPSGTSDWEFLGLFGTKSLGERLTRN